MANAKMNFALKKGGRTSSGRQTQAYTHDCTVLADSSHGDSHVGSVSPAATRTRTLALTLTRTLTLALTQGGSCGTRGPGESPK